MLSVNEAFKIILSTSIKLEIEEIKINDATNRTLAQDIISTRQQPPFDRVAMDGIAIHINKPIADQYKIEGIQPAGSPQLTLINLDNCIEVMTGAILPKNCNCVIPYEKINIHEGYASLANKEIKLFQNIHKKGHDYNKDTLIINKMKLITSPIQAIIASQGNSRVQVFKQPSIFIISTGSELVELDEKIEQHQIYMSNSYAIESELIAQGFSNISRIHIVDDYQVTLNKIKQCLDKAELLILTGGVSAGKFDFVPQVLKELEVNEGFHKVKQKPGKPFWYGTKDNKQIFALPGNPVSCLATLRRYVIESLKHSMGQENKPVYATLDSKVEFSRRFTLFQPVSLVSTKEGSSIAKPIKGNGSGDFYSLGESTGFLELPENESIYEQGQSYRYFAWGK
jgi:molybdopterin molybdotransferase